MKMMMTTKKKMMIVVMTKVMDAANGGVSLKILAGEEVCFEIWRL
jgi:hypothetical protein